MPYQLQLKPYEGQKGGKCKIITITDITLHTNKLRPTLSPGKKIRESMEKQEPGRIYSSIIKDSNSSTFILEMIKKDPELLRLIQDEERKGYKVLLALPNDGIPILAGKDTQDFIKSIKGQRVLRWLDKKNKKE